MDPKVILRFVNSSKAGTTAEFPVKQFRNINIGRDTSCEVAFDADRDDLVSRIHAKITIEAGTPPSYTIADCESRNGTFVNHQRITGSVTLSYGDAIQLGPGGPEFVFQMEPRISAPKATRLATPSLPPSTEPPMPTTRTVPMQVASAAVPPLPKVTPPSETVAPNNQTAGKQTIGKQTVERMIHEEHGKSKKTLIATLIAAAAVVLLAASLAIPAVRQKIGLSSGSMSAKEIAKTTNESVVFFEAGWKLIDTESGRSLYQVYMPNHVAVEQSQQQPAQNGPGNGNAPSPQPPNQQSNQQPDQQAEPQTREIIPGAPAMLPAFTQVDGALEPILTTEAGDGRNKAVGGRHSGSGFVVSPEGFILTNRHVASAWITRYDFDAPAGLVLQSDGPGRQKLIPIGASQFPNWLPSHARFILRGKFDPSGPLTPIAIGGKAVEGRNDYLDVTFPKNRERVQAKLIRTSDQADVAMVKIDMPRPLQTLQLLDNYDSIAQGDEISVMGYPGVSPLVIGAVQSREAITPTVEQRIIPDPTLSVGNIGRIIRGKVGLTETAVSQFGDVYQLTVTSTGAGNSGGPVLDASARVIGLFTYAIQGDVRLTFAVPIRYGMELMGTKPVM